MAGGGGLRLETAPLLASYLVVAAMLTATVGLWFRWGLRNIRDGKASAPLPGVPRGKYAAWAVRKTGAPERKTSPHKTLRRRG